MSDNLPQAEPVVTLPEAFTAKLKKMYPDQAATILAAFTQPRPTTFRVNSLKASISAVVAELHAAGFVIEAVPWLAGAYILFEPSLYQLSQHPVYLEGKIYVQGLSSMLPAVVLAPTTGERVLDMCAAPGSKTTQMAAQMENGGEILANDTSLVRLYKLQANLERQGVTNVTTRRGRGQQLWQFYPDYFDKALVDAPCSMEGRFLLTKPKTIDGWSERKVKELSTRQKYLLWAAVGAVRPGGEIVYSTCTLSPEENEAVVDWLLKKMKGKVELMPIEVDSIPWQPALKEWGKWKFSEPVVQFTRRVVPTETLEGFFVAKFKKL